MEKEVFIIGIFAWKLKEMIKPLYVFLFLFPLAGALSFGGLLEERGNDLAIPIAIVDEDGSDFSMAIVEGMKEQERLQVMELTFKEADNQLARNELDCVFVIKKGFQKLLMTEERESAVKLLTSSVSMASGIVKEVFASEVTKLTSAVIAANRVESLYNEKDIRNPKIWQEAYQFSMEQWIPEPLMTVSYEIADVRESEKTNVRNEEEPHRYLGLWTFFVLLSCFVTSDWFVKERGYLFARISTTAVGLKGYLFQTMAAHILFYLLQGLIMAFLMDYLAFIDLNIPLLVALLAYILFSISISLGVGSISKNLGSYYASAIFISFIVVFMGESLFPIADLSTDLASVTGWFPQALLFATATGGKLSFDMMPAVTGLLASGMLSLWLVARRLKVG